MCDSDHVLEGDSTDSISSYSDTARQSPGGPAAVSSCLLWPSNKRRLKVRFLDGSGLEKRSVIYLVKEHYHTIPMGLRFKFLEDNSPDPAEIRITFNTNESYSYVGRDALKHPVGPTMWLNLKGKIMDEKRCARTVLHEFGHALGMKHEHQHPDFDVSWNISNLKARFGWDTDKVHSNYEKETEPWVVWKETYDPQSIMHYSIEPGDTASGIMTLKSNNVLSAGDRAFLIKNYPRREEPELTLRLKSRVKRKLKLRPGPKVTQARIEKTRWENRRKVHCVSHPFIRHNVYRIDYGVMPINNGAGLINMEPSGVSSNDRSHLICMGPGGTSINNNSSFINTDGSGYGYAGIDIDHNLYSYSNASTHRNGNAALYV